MQDKKENPDVSTGEPEVGEHEGEEDKENDVNKSGSIPLIRKCEIVQHAKKLMETQSVKYVEQEIMRLYPKEFLSASKRGYKSGLLAKWTRTVSLAESLVPNRRNLVRISSI